MKFLMTLLLCLTSFCALAVNEDFQIHFATLGPKQQEEKLGVEESFLRKSQMVYGVDKGLLLRTYIRGLEIGPDGLFNYDVKIEGLNRNPKSIRQFGGITSASSEARADEVIVESEPQMFWKEDIGIWDFKITVTDRVSGEKRMTVLKGVEVRK